MSLRGTKYARPVAQSPRKSALHVAEKRGHRSIASQSGTIHVDELPRDRVPHLFQLKNSPRQFGFPSAGGAHQEQRITRGNGDLFDPVNQFVERLVPGIDPSFRPAAIAPVIKM